jgi:aspartyl/asparaginyl beta-hydroxylase (cupin superfamily)
MHALKADDYGRARHWFAAAAAVDPHSPALWINLATACRGQNDVEGEEESLEKALSLDQRNFVAQLRLAELFDRSKRKPEAVMRWSAVVQLGLAMDTPAPLVVDAIARGQAYLAEHRRGFGHAIEAGLEHVLTNSGPTARRFRACVDHALGRRAIYTNQCAGLHYPFLPADEFFDRQHFSWLSELEANTSIIRAEMEAVLKDRQGSFRPYVRQGPGTPENEWTPLDNNLAWGAFFLWEYGVRFEDACSRCPATAAALEAIPRADMPNRAPTAFFSILGPKARIPPHTGVSNTRAIVHLPLVVPKQCGFRVGGTTREWREGEAFAFDDTIEHEAWNDSEEPRAVLIFDVWNPHLSIEERTAVRQFFQIADANGNYRDESWQP